MALAIRIMEVKPCIRTGFRVNLTQITDLGLDIVVVVAGSWQAVLLLASYRRAPDSRSLPPAPSWGARLRTSPRWRACASGRAHANNGAEGWGLLQLPSVLAFQFRFGEGMAHAKVEGRGGSFLFGHTCKRGSLWKQSGWRLSSTRCQSYDLQLATFDCPDCHSLQKEKINEKQILSKYCSEYITTRCG